jgi:subtilisin family serine protease
MKTLFRVGGKMKAMIATLIMMLSSQLLANSFDNFGQTNVHNKDIQNIIIKTKSKFNLQTMGMSRSVMAQRPIIDELNIHLLKVNPSLNVNAILAEVRKNPNVVYAQLDHKVTARVANGPNDTDFANEWSMGDTNGFGIDAINAWATYGTGGKDANNNDIVVAVVDGGIEITHDDLVDNIWVNEAEIPGNGIDDDQNGYVDDIHGWNAFTNSGEQKTNSHGTHVAGIIGAKGNNNHQVAGVNWDVKIMNVPGSSGNTSVVLTAYKYVLDQKKLWLATNGAQGANIVSTNSSFGVDRANCNSGSYPAWNDIYTEMGKVGILSAAATANNDYDVDKVGDVPTGCDSPFIISVTNSNNTGERDFAGFGKKAIDLAAPGTDIFSTFSGNSTAKLTGTSMATPHVAGAVAFLNSVASQTLTDLYKNDPENAALEMKRIILETVTKRPSLENETVSGGILNLNAAAAEVVSYGLGR